MPRIKTVPLLQRYQRLIDISNDLASTLDLDILLHRIVSAAADLTKAEAASILLYDQAKHKLYFQVSTNLELPVMRGLSVPVEGSIAGWIIKNNQPVNVSNAHHDPRFYGHIEKATSIPTNSLLGVPMIHKGETIGVVESINKVGGIFDETDQDVLMTLGSQAAVAVTNARLFQQSDLIAEMAHELRTPLGSLNAATHVLLHPEATDEKKKQMVEIIQGETKRLSYLANSFLDLARLESGRTQFDFQEFDLIELLKESVEIIRSQFNESGISIHSKISRNIPNIFADRDKIKQVILNLLNNAHKFNNKNGKIFIQARPLHDQVQISITDSGPGIPEEHLERIFEKFYRVPGIEKLAMGTGLGLPICQKIINAHGGMIFVKSKVGVGSTFGFSLPAHRDKR